MAEDETAGKNLSLTLPVGALGAALALGVAAVAYTYLTKGEESEDAPSKGKSSSMRKKLGLMTVITLLENDATRKVVISVLKAMARRA